MQTMSDEDVHAFLAEAPWVGVLATTRADGRPHAVPVWFGVDGSTIVLTTAAKSVKGRNLLRDPQCALTVHDDRPPYSFALVEGEVTITRNRDELAQWAVTIATRYVGAEQGEEAGQRNAGFDDILVRIVPRRLTGVRNIAED